MSLARAPLEHYDGATQSDWFAPLAAFIAWLAHLFEQIAKLKRIRGATKFKPNWRDHWDGLRQLEWMRDQVLAACAVRLLAGETLDAESDFTPSTEPPADYGGPCPKTPFEMNRRFLAIARFNADPESAIRAHTARIAKRMGIDLGGCPLRLGLRQATSPALHAGEESREHDLLSSLAGRRGRWIAMSSSRDGGDERRRRRRDLIRGIKSRSECPGRGSRSSRGPPLDSVQNHKRLCLAAPTCVIARPYLALTFRARSATYASTLEPKHMKPSKPA